MYFQNKLSHIFLKKFIRFSLAPIARNGTNEIYGVVSAGFECNKPIQSRIGIYTVVNSPLIYYSFVGKTLRGTIRISNLIHLNPCII